MQLAASQETYFALSDIFAGKFAEADEAPDVRSAKPISKNENLQNGKSARDRNTSDVLRAVDSFFSEEQHAADATEKAATRKPGTVDDEKKAGRSELDDDRDSDADEDDNEDDDDDDAEDDDDDDDDEDYSGEENDDETASVDGSELSGPDDIEE
jgi:hypothetical protein